MPPRTCGARNHLKRHFDCLLFIEDVHLLLSLLSRYALYIYKHSSRRALLTFRLFLRWPIQHMIFCLLLKHTTLNLAFFKHFNGPYCGGGGLFLLLPARAYAPHRPTDKLPNFNLIAQAIFHRICGDSVRARTLKCAFG